MRYLLIVAVLMGTAWGGYYYGKGVSNIKWHDFMERYLNEQISAYLDNGTILIPPGTWRISPAARDVDNPAPSR